MLVEYFFGYQKWKLGGFCHNSKFENMWKHYNILKFLWKNTIYKIYYVAVRLLLEEKKTRFRLLNKAWDPLTTIILTTLTPNFRIMIALKRWSLDNGYFNKLVTMWF